MGGVNVVQSEEGRCSACGEAHLPENSAACAFRGLFPYTLKHCSCQGSAGALFIRELGGCPE